MPLETTAYLGNGGPVDHSTITSYWVSAATATRTRPGLPVLTANMIEPAETWTRQALTDGGTTTWRYTETDTTYDAPPATRTSACPPTCTPTRRPANPAYDQCAATTYAPANTTENLVGPGRLGRDRLGGLLGIHRGIARVGPGRAEHPGRPG